MLSAINGNNQIQMMNALNAFKSAEKINKPEFQSTLNTSSGVNLSDNNSLLEKVNLSEIKNFAQKVGETNLTDEDIKYGLTYGRSVIANYVA